ncbi:hypothetical protein EMCRGX_G025091 [Ephydatia muelleri]
MEQRPRKVRGSSQRSAYPSSNKHGLYNDKPLVAEITGLLGCVVEVTTREGVVYEGVLTEVSPDMETITQLAHVKTEKLSRDNVQKFLQLKFCDIVTIVAKVSTNPSMEQKDTLKLDKDISSSTGSSGNRELQRFTDFEESENAVVNLGLDGSGWGPEEMWRENEEKFNVQSTYDESLIQYTTPLERTDTEEFRRKEARAKRLASEIENKQDWPALNENFDSTEEERQVAVETLCLILGTNSKPADTSVGVPAVRVEPLQVEPVNKALATQETEAMPHDLHVNGGEHSVHGTDEEEGSKTKEEVIRAFQLNPSAKEFTPSASASASAKEFTPLEFVSPPSVQSPIISPHSQSPQAFYSPNKRPFSTFQKPHPRPFISPDPAIPMAASGYIYQNPGVAMSPQPLARPFVPGSMVMPGPFAMSGIVSPQQQLMSGKMVEFFPPPPPVLTAMGQMAAQQQHYIGPLGQPGQPFSAPPQMIQANQQMYYMSAMQQGTVPNFIPTQQVMPQFLMLPRK